MAANGYSFARPGSNKVALSLEEWLLRFLASLQGPSQAMLGGYTFIS
ncbi:MAG: hypothetical protein GXY34_13265 [Syntrophomonadaceae bacterium]|nr:hypothetical protein [Syntrophomonadaceae bacterium]